MNAPNDEQTDNSNNHQINMKALCHALYELLELNWFIADTSRLLQQEDLIEDESIVTGSYRVQLAAILEKSANKSSELYDVVQKAINVNLTPQEHKPNIRLLDMPSDILFYYGDDQREGVLNQIK